MPQGFTCYERSYSYLIFSMLQDENEYKVKIKPFTQIKRPRILLKRFIYDDLSTIGMTPYQS